MLWILMKAYGWMVMYDLKSSQPVIRKGGTRKWLNSTFLPIVRVQVTVDNIDNNTSNEIRVFYQISWP